MGPIPMDNDGPRDKMLVVQNNYGWDEQKGIMNVVLGDHQGFGPSEEDETRINGVAEELNNGSEGATQGPDGLQKPQPQAPVISWERFLPVRSLKVLLVENDDSTRHVVSALLRNCSYEVTAVANALQAWKILEDLTNHTDLVLTEVDMPFLSGIGLLCKIMSHKTFKNIPVIMMSSHDSMGLVFKCLSKGAVDFLVKPIRKNELKNLWQHIWRRCQSSSGSGSESGTQTKKSAKSRSNDDSENDTGSSDERDNGSIGLSIWDGSDNGSGTQSSWTKRAAEVDSPQPKSEWDQLPDAPDRICAQVIHTKPETCSSRWLHIAETKECQEQDDQLGNIAMGKDLEMGASRNPDKQLEHQQNCSTHPTSKRQNKLSEIHNRPFNTSATIASPTNPQVESRTLEAPNELSDVSQIKVKANCGFRELPSLELTLKRLGGFGDLGSSLHDDRNVLRHSDLSAFSKYNTASSASKAPTGNVGSCSPLDNSSVAMKTETTHNSNWTPPNQWSNGSSNKNYMAPITKCVPKPEALHDKSESTSVFKCFQNSMFQPTQNGQVFAPHQRLPGKADDVTVSTDQVQSRGSHHQVQVPYHHIHNMQNQPQLDYDDLSLKNMAAAACQCGSSNILGGPIEGDGGNYNVNGSTSGSDHGSNGQNGSSNALNIGVKNIGSNNGAAGNSGVVSDSGRVNGNGADENRFAQREAALTKFRQKRKERCFEKKVRYQSRKKLAEQRPRIRGQFVRQIVADNKAGKEREQDIITPKDNSCVTVYNSTSQSRDLPTSLPCAR